MNYNIKTMTEKDNVLLFTKGQCKDCIYKRVLNDRSAYCCMYMAVTGLKRDSMPPNCSKYKDNINNNMQSSFNNWW